MDKGKSCGGAVPPIFKFSSAVPPDRRQVSLRPVNCEKLGGDSVKGSRSYGRKVKAAGVRLPQFSNSQAAGVPPDRRLYRSVAFQLGLEPGAVRVGSAGVPRGTAPPRLLRERQRRRRPAQRTDCLVDTTRYDTRC